MGDVNDLVAAFDQGALLRPAPEALNLVDLACAVAQWAGAEGLPRTPWANKAAEYIGPGQHLILVLADGLGMNLLEALPGGAFLPRHVAVSLRTVFPSATAVALTSLATARWPGQHAVVGWWTHLPEIRGAATILQFAARSDRRPLSELKMSTQQAFPVPSAFARFKRDTLAILPQRIAGGTYTDYFTGGRAVVGSRSLAEAVDIAVERVRRAEAPTFTYLYTGRIDETAHTYGLTRPEVTAALTDLNREMERLAEGLAGKGRVLLTADHGFLDTAEGSRHEIRFYDPLLSFLWYPPSGDARVLYLHAKPGTRGRIRDYFYRRFGARFSLLTVEEAEVLNLFGPEPLSPVARSRLGDLIAISHGADAVEYRVAGGNGRVMQEASQHSGLTPQEMLVPLVVA
ncbi:MAG: alkaline phosphatase family protein [Chloroflexi bacterium]|nr:alkaline phosphatase family protein [Chloroflexota bacterium]